MDKLALFALALACALLLPTAAGADEDDDPFDRTGFYVGVSAVYNHNIFEDNINGALDLVPGLETSVDIEDSWGANGRIGYRAASWFAAELQYEWVDSFDVDGKVEATGVTLAKGTIVTIEGHTLTLNTKWIVPFWRTQPYVLLGAGYAYYDADVGSAGKALRACDPCGNPDIRGGSKDSFAGRLGGGIDFYITKNVVLNTEATVVLTTEDFSSPDSGNIDDLNYVSFGAGLQYRF